MTPERRLLGRCAAVVTALILGLASCKSDGGGCKNGITGVGCEVKITITPSEGFELQVQQSGELTVSISGGKTTPTLASCTTQNASIATASVSGTNCRVVGVSAGNTTVTARTSTNESASAAVKVTPLPPALTGTLTLTPPSATLTVGQAGVTLVPNPVKAAASVNVSYSFSSNAPAIATVDPNTGSVTAVSAGSAVITATATGSGAGFSQTTQQATAAINVNAAPAAITAFSVTPANPSLVVGQSVPLVPNPTKSSPSVAVSFTYSSDAQGVATVSPSGVVTAVGPGSATITANATGSGVGFSTNNLSTTVPVTVAARAPTTVSLAAANDTLSPLGTRQLTLVVRDQLGNVLPGVGIAWNSSDLTIATVSATGLVTAVANGTVTIRARVATGTGTDSLSATTTFLIAPPCSLIRPIQFGSTYNGRFDASSCHNFVGFGTIDQFSLTSNTQAYYSVRLVPTTAKLSLVPLNIGSGFYGIPDADTTVVGFGVMRAGTFGFIVAASNNVNTTYTVTTTLNPDPRLACVTTDVTRGVTFVTALLPTCQQRDIRILPAIFNGGQITITATAQSFPAQINLMEFQSPTVLASASAAVTGGTATLNYTSDAFRFLVVRVIGGAAANDFVTISINQ